MAVALAALTGFAAPVAVRAAGETAPVGLAADELVGELATLGARGRELDAEIARLQAERAALAATGPDPAELAAARARAEAYAVLAGTVPVAGPGLALTIDDPRGNVGADVLVGALQELRDAGAEAIELGGVRLVTESYILDATGGGMVVDGATVRPPYRLLVIGDPHTLAQAMRIPGGVLDTVAARSGASARIAELPRAEIHAVRPAADTPGPGG
ncbi:MAG: DUF881 domain-containing protein [Frankia sp.]|nr:DUF881 domain-containing protein [Frankia sp.]